MTREEAINILKNEKPHCGEKIRYTEGDICEAFDMAINSLKIDEMVDDMSSDEDEDETISIWLIENIKTEIENQSIKKDKKFIEEIWWNSALQKSCEIIDKYLKQYIITESEK